MIEALTKCPHCGDPDLIKGGDFGTWMCQYCDWDESCLREEGSNIIVLHPWPERRYNAKDAPGHERATQDRKPWPRIYCVEKIENGIAHCYSENAWHRPVNDQWPVETLVPYYPAHESTTG